MKRLAILILISGVFLAGYYVGHLPGSPDLVPTARSCYAKVADAYQSAADWITAKTETMGPAIERVASAAEDGSSSEQHDADNQ